MGKVNWSRVVTCGLVAGIVLIVIDWVVYGMLLRADMAAAMQALGHAEANSGSAVIWYVVLDLFFGIWLLWLYAAIRPRYGAGPKTALCAGLAMWVLFGLLHALSEMPMHLYPTAMYCWMLLTALVEYPLAAVVGAKWYTEGGAAGAA